MRRRPHWLVIVVAAIVLVMLARWSHREYRKRADERERKAAFGRAAQAYSDFEACLLGEPLAAGEEAFRRYRAIELTALRAPGALAMGPGEHAWPGRCVPHAEALARELEASDADASVASMASSFAKTRLMPGEMFGFVIERVFKGGRETFPSRPPARADIPRPPSPSPAFHADTLTELPEELDDFGPSLGAQVDREPYVRFSHYSKDAAACRLASGGAGLELDCVTYRGFKYPELGAAAEGVRPPVFDHYGPLHHGDTGAALLRGPTHGAYAWADGSVTSIGLRSAEGPNVTVLVHHAGDQPREEVVNVPPEDSVVLLGTTLFERRRAGAGFELVARELAAPGASPGPRVVIGPLPAKVFPVRVCRTPEALAVFASGDEGAFIALRIGASWSPLHAVDPGHALTCRGTEVTLTGVVRDPAGVPIVRQVRCTRERCTSVSVPFATIRGVPAAAPAPAPAKADPLATFRRSHEPSFNDVDAVDLDGQLLVVWADAPEAGLRARLAPIDAIAKARDLVLFDPFINDFRVGALGVVKVIGAGPAAAVFFTSFGMKRYALRIDAGGAFAPLPVTIERPPS